MRGDHWGGSDLSDSQNCYVQVNNDDDNNRDGGEEDDDEEEVKDTGREKQISSVFFH